MHKDFIEDLEFSVFHNPDKGIKTTIPKKNITFTDLVQAYKSDSLKTLSQNVLNAPDELKQTEKKKLPFITAHGTFKNRRVKENIDKHNSHLIAVDVDKVTEEEAEAIKVKLSSHFSCLLCCLSPRKKGVKALILSDEPLTPENRYKTLKTNISLIAETIGIPEFTDKIDLAQFKLAQPFFLGYDENIYYNFTAEPVRFEFKEPELYQPGTDNGSEQRTAKNYTPYTGPISSPPTDRFKKVRVSQYLQNTANNLEAMFKTRTEGDRHSNIIKVNILSKWMHYAPEFEGMIKSKLLNAVVNMYTDKDDRESAERSFNDAWTPDTHEGNEAIEKIINEQEETAPTMQPIKHIENVPRLEYIKGGEEVEAPRERKVFIPTWDNKPEEKEPLVYCGGTSILTHQNVSVVIASPGSGKSSLCEAICASVLNSDIDALGFKVNDKISKVLYIDNERTNTDVWNSFKRMSLRAKLKPGESQDKVLIAGLRMVARLDERLSEIEKLIQEHKPDLILLDGAGDLVNDTNSLEEAVNCRVWLRELTSKYELSILTTLHPNKGTMNPRGHIGSEILREAEGVIGVIPGANDTRTITTDFAHGKNRNNKKEDLAHYVWSDEVSMFVSVEAPERGRPKALSLFEALTDQELSIMLSNVLNEAKGYTELVEGITAYLKRQHPRLRSGGNAVKNLITELTESNYLIKSRNGRSVVYSCSQMKLEELLK